MMDVKNLAMRSLEERDLAALGDDLGLSRRHIADRWRERQAGELTMLIADIAGTVVGSVSFDERDMFKGLLHLYALEVVPDVQRRGIGTRLVEAVEAEAAQRGLSGMHLAVATDNVEAIRLYQRLAFKRTGEPYTSRWIWYGTNGERREIVERCFRMVKRGR